MKLHRNPQKRIYIKDTCYFLTAKTYDNFLYFQERIFCELFIENLKLCKGLYGFLLFGWVLVYDHFHLLMLPGGERDMSKIMFSVKKQFSHNCNVVIGRNDSWNPSIEGAQSIGHLQRKWPNESHNPITHFRIGNKWLESHKSHDKQTIIQKLHTFDKFVLSLQTRFRIKYPNNPFPKFKWQKSFRDHYIRCKNDFINCMRYIAYNPEKHNLPPNWEYVFTNEKYNYLTDEP